RTIVSQLQSLTIWPCLIGNLGCWRHSLTSIFLCTDSSFPRPSINLGPVEIAAFGGNVTIQCQSEKLTKRFYLHKSRNQMPQQILETNGTTAEFLITSVDQTKTGEYCCRYSDSSEPYIVSKCSDLVRLLVTEKPEIFISPGKLITLGENLTIVCEIEDGDVIFFLHKNGSLKPEQMKSTSYSLVEFFISNVTWQDQGSYSCSYVKKEQIFVLSVQSDAIELVISVEGRGNPQSPETVTPGAKETRPEPLCGCCK
uniref:Ig-like domain-containing protein n=1 Tax=Salvator merianae TaxID=96440 RepID=A0A8D0B8B5_SALMN